MIPIALLQSNTLNNSTVGSGGALSTLTEVSLGTWIGFLVTLVASFGIFVIRIWSKRRRLRRSLAEEINTQNISRITNSINSDIDTEVSTNGSEDEYQVNAAQLPPADSLPTQIYQSSAMNLGILPSVEISELVKYYSLLTTQKGIIRSIRSAEDVAHADKRELCRNMSSLEGMKSDVLSSLRDRTICERVLARLNDACQSDNHDGDS